MEETLENSCFISVHRNQINPVLQPKSTLTFALGDRKWDKLQRQMGSDDNKLRTKILIEINEDFHDGSKLNEAIAPKFEGEGENEEELPTILNELVRCFEEQDDTIRELASRAIIKVASTEKGRQTLIDLEIVPMIKDLFNDEQIQIRANAYKAMIAVAEYTYGIDQIIHLGILPVLIDKLVEEKIEVILILILSLLKVLMEGEMAPMVIQSSDALDRLNKHLTSPEYKIRELSAMNLGSISYNQIGKEQAIEARSIPPLCNMLSDKVSEVRTAATRALNSLAQNKEGKVQIYDLDKLNEIIKLLSDFNEQTRLNTVQLICNVAEYPPAKEKFKECLPKLQEIKKKEEDSHPLVARYAQQAIDVIAWMS